MIDCLDTRLGERVSAYVQPWLWDIESVFLSGEEVPNTSYSSYTVQLASGICVTVEF